MGFRDLHAKLVSRFNTNIPTKKSSTKLFGITQAGRESTQAYLKRFNEDMLKVEELIKPLDPEALIRGVKECSLWRDLYALHDRGLMKVKQVMENHIRVEEVNILRHRPSCFYQEA
jgi:hypothetical protein